MSQFLSSIVLATSLLFFDLAAVAVAANEPNPSRLELTTDRVIVFKDGYCLVVKQGTATTDADGFAFTEDVPDAAILGSFWAVPKKGTIRSMVAGWRESTSEAKREISCTSAVEIIQSNLGKHCSFEVGEQQHRGTLLKILSNDELVKEKQQIAAAEIQLLSSVSRPGATVSRPLPEVTTSSVTGNYFVLRTGNGDVMIATNAIRNLTIENMNSSIEQTTTTKSHQKRLTMNFGKPDQKININLMYFRPGVRWIPTYRINLSDKPFVAEQPENTAEKNVNQKTAEILMQGEILNEAEDFVDVPFHVVVGVPNFRFRSVPSPMVLESSMRNLLAQAAPGIMGNAFNNGLSNALYSQRASEFHSNRAVGDPAQGQVDFPAELSGKSGNDLYVYELDKMTLKRGERAAVPILSTEVAYRNIYTWDIHVTHSESYSASSGKSTSPIVLTENRIWRQIELINDSDIPWTTGAAMFVDGFQPLAQELLTYTSPGGICRVPVTVSVDLRGRIDDSEVKRELKAIEWRGYHYARAIGKIEVELANNKTESVPVEVTLQFGGKANKASDDGKITLGAFRKQDWNNHQGHSVNNSSRIRWTSNVEPGECFKPLVDYEFFIRY